MHGSRKDLMIWIVLAVFCVVVLGAAIVASGSM